MSDVQHVQIELVPASREPWIDLESFDFRRNIERQQALHVLCQLFVLRGGELRVVVGTRVWTGDPTEMTTLFANAHEILTRIHREQVAELSFVDPGFRISFVADPVDGLSMQSMASADKVALDATPVAFAHMLYQVVNTFYADARVVCPRLARSATMRAWYHECASAHQPGARVGLWEEKELGESLES